MRSNIYQIKTEKIVETPFQIDVQRNEKKLTDDRDFTRKKMSRIRVKLVVSQSRVHVQDRLAIMMGQVAHHLDQLQLFFELLP